MFDVKLVGSLWKTAPRALDNSARRLDRWQRHTLKTFTKEVHEKFQNGILRQGSGYHFRFRALNKAYVRSKVDMGLAKTQLVATEEYVHAIERKVKGAGAGATIEMRRGTHSMANLRYSEMASYLENGTRNMQKLPHWRPMEKQALRSVNDHFGRMPNGLISFS